MWPSVVTYLNSPDKENPIASWNIKRITSWAVILVSLETKLLTYECSERLTIFAALVVEEVLLKIIAEREERATLMKPVVSTVATPRRIVQTYSLVRRHVAIGANDALVVCRRDKRSEGNEGDSELENHCVDCGCSG